MKLKTGLVLCDCCGEQPDVNGLVKCDTCFLFCCDDCSTEWRCHTADPDERVDDEDPEPDPYNDQETFHPCS